MKKHFLTGLVILLPLALTIAIASSLINFFTGPFVEVVALFLQKFKIAQQGFLFLSHDKIIHYLSKFLILVFLFSLIVALGIITRWYLMNAFLILWDRLLQKIPFISSVYKTIKEIIKTLFTSNKSTFKQVVMVPFPGQGIYALGLISGDFPQSSLVSVLIPTTPNPTSGFLLMYQKTDLIYLDMKPEEAFKYILSCGIITPQKIS